MHDLPQRLYRTKLSLLAILLSVFGIALMVSAGPDGHLARLPYLPLAELGSAMFTTGVIGIAAVPRRPRRGTASQ